MFSQTITYSDLTSYDANVLFEGKIWGDSYKDDQSFVASLRALVHSRIGEGESLYFSLENVERGKDDVNSRTVSRITRMPGASGIRLVMFNTGSELRNKEWMEYIRGIKLPEGYIRLDRFNAFFSPVFDAECYVHIKEKKSIVFASGISYRYYHYLQVGIPVILPWYFTVNNITDDEMDLIKSFQQRRASQYTDAITRISRLFDLETVRKKRLLRNVEKQFEKARLDELKNKLDVIMREIGNYNEYLADKIREKRQTETNIMGLQMRTDGEETTEIMDYFVANKSIQLEDVVGSEIRFYVTGYATYFDEDAIESVLSNKESFVYKNSYSVSGENMARLIKAVFIDGTIRLRFVAGYRLDMGGGIHTLRVSESTRTFDGYMPNPHIEEYSCMGDYTATVNEAMLAGNYISAIEQCVASCQSLNFCDYTVMEKFMRWLYDGNSKTRAFELPDGRVVMPKEAIEWLNAESKEE